MLRFTCEERNIWKLSKSLKELWSYFQIKGKFLLSQTNKKIIIEINFG